MTNKELEKVEKWLDANKRALNVGKTNFAIFPSPQHALVRTANNKIDKDHVNQPMLSFMVSSWVKISVGSTT